MRRTLLTMMLAVAAGHACACGPLTASDAWVRLAPPGASVMAGYVKLANASSVPVSIEAGSAKDFERVELHSMSMDSGVMQMRKLDSIEVKAGTDLALAPGGMHLMLIGPKHAFVAGDTIEAVLTLCGETEQTVTLTVREPTPD